MASPCEYCAVPMRRTAWILNRLLHPPVLTASPATSTTKWETPSGHVHIDYRPALSPKRISQMSASLTALVKYTRRASGANAIEKIARPRSGSA